MAKKKFNQTESKFPSQQQREPGPALPHRGSERFPIVGVGASAGGLQALRELLQAMPDEPGVAIVIVQHLARDQPSLTQELLARCTSMDVLQVQQATPVLVNHERLLQLIHPDDRERFVQHHRSAIESPSADGYEGEFRMVRPDGEVRWVVDRGTVLLSDDELRRPLRAVGIIQDVTEQKHAESQLRELNKSLEDQVQQRTELLNLLQSVTSIANEGASIEETLRAALAKIISVNGWTIGHVWRMVDDEAGTFESSGLWQFPPDAEQTISGFHEFRQKTKQMRFVVGQGLIGKAVQSGQPQWLNDIEQSNHYRRKLHGLGLHATIAFPITIDGETVAVMEFFSTTSSQPPPRMIEVMGGLGFINKQEATDRLIAGIRAILSGELYFSQHITQNLLRGRVGNRKQRPSGGMDALTNRELQVFELIGLGRSTREIADHLFLSVKTIERHKENLKQKLQLENATQLVQRAAQWMLRGDV